MTESVKTKLEETYRHMEPYMDDAKELHAMCERWEEWSGKDHDYSGCRHKPCFMCWLGLQYVMWRDSYGG